MDDSYQEYNRFCPGEEQIKISEAICIGRRRSNYPKCPGCPFNDDEKDAPAADQSHDTEEAAAPEVKSDPVDRIFRANDIRGRIPDEINPEVAWRLGQAMARFLRSELRGYDRSETEKSTIVVARDMRKSSVDILGGVVNGLRSAGAPVIDIGMIDAGQLYFAVNHLTCCGGIMVTVSDLPAQHNGIKLCGPKGRPVYIETGLGQIQKSACNILKRNAALQGDYRQVDLTDEYRTFVRGFLHSATTRFSPDRPLKVVVDGSNGMAGRWFLTLFGQEEWLSITRLNFEHNGEFVHPPDPIEPANLEQLRDRCLRSKADLGIFFDGDAGRCVFVDNEGQLLQPDLAFGLLACYMIQDNPGAHLIYDLRCSKMVPEAIRQAGGLPRRERSGPGVIKKSMADARALFGGTLDGYVFFRDNWYGESAMMAVATMFNLLGESEKTLSELMRPWRRYAHTGPLYFENDRAQAAVDRLADRYAGGQADYTDGVTLTFDDWWFNVRALPDRNRLRFCLEAEDAAARDAMLDELTPILGRLVGRYA